MCSRLLFCVPSPVASVVVQHGTLRCGDVLVAGQGWGKVRAMFDESRQPLREAPPSTPVLTVGWRELPAAGEDCLQVNVFQLCVISVL